MAHVVRGDRVVIIKGKERGSAASPKLGTVKRVLTNGRVEVEKINMVKRHTKPTQKDPQGGIKEVEGSIALANVQLWCEKCSAGRRSKKVVDDSGSKQRACVKCDTTFPNPGM
jgi:large subunit ribosomal protein L24